MQPPSNQPWHFRGRKLTGLRIALAFLVGLTADGLQILLAPVPLAVQIIDLLAMILTTILLGFHPLFLPTFVVELIPVIDLLPTWTGCVALVVTLRRRQQAASAAPPRQTYLPPPGQ